MHIGMVGLGRMGANLVRRLHRGGHRCTVFDLDPSLSRSLAAEVGATAATSIADLVDQLEPPRAVWVMVPAAATGAVIDEVAGHLAAGDVVIDGGNTHYRDDVDRAGELATSGIHLVDVGTSGGVFGLDRGFCLMIGGETEVLNRLVPLFRTLAPGVDSAPRTPGSSGPPSTAEQGWLHCGPNGAGHFVKMVHNGIEYGLMAAFAEGMNLLAHADAGSIAREPDAEATPMREPRYYRYQFDLPAIAEVWRRGSVISSWLLDLTAAALVADPELRGFSGEVADSGEGRWTVEAAVDLGVPAHVLTAALFQRFSSRGEADLANRILSSMRQQFGGHEEHVIPEVGMEAPAPEDGT